MGAIQAQDYAQALWAVGSRTAESTAAQIEQAVIDRQILRTWTLREEQRDGVSYWSSGGK